jgi:hypothetical protein
MRENKKDFLKLFLWIAIGFIGVTSFGGIALIRGEKISSLWFSTACICTQLVAYSILT